MLSKRSNLTEKQEKFLTEKKYWCIFLSIPIQLFLHFLHSLIAIKNQWYKWISFLKLEYLL